MRLTPRQKQILAQMYNGGEPEPARFMTPLPGRTFYTHRDSLDGSLVIFATGMSDWHLCRRGLIKRVRTPNPNQFHYELTDLGVKAARNA